MVSAPTQKAVSGLPVHRYSFPPQEAALSQGKTLHEVGGKEVGSVDNIDQVGRSSLMKKRGAAAEVHPAAVLVEERVSPRPMDTLILAFARSVVEHGVDGEGPFRARLRSHRVAELQLENESAVEAAQRLVDWKREDLYRGADGLEQHK